MIALLVSFEASARFVPHGEDAGRALLWALLIVPVWMLILKLYGLYDRDLKRSATPPWTTSRGSSTR